MSLSFPYSLPFFCDRLRANRVRLSLRRNDEQSGGGDGRFWTAELARPLWTAEISLVDRTETLARDLEARIDGLDGSRGTFLFADPTYKGPASGQTDGLDAVTVSNIRADRGAIALAGLPAGFVLSPGDHLSINYGTGKVYFGKFSEGGKANGSGALTMRDVRPYLPLTITAGAAVELVRPCFVAIIPPDGYIPFNYELPRGEIASGASITILQKP